MMVLKSFTHVILRMWADSINLQKKHSTTIKLKFNQCLVFLHSCGTYNPDDARYWCHLVSDQYQTSSGSQVFILLMSNQIPLQVHLHLMVGKLRARKV